MTLRYHLAPDLTPRFTDEGAILEAVDGFQVIQDPTVTAMLRMLAEEPAAASTLAAALGVPVRSTLNDLAALVRADIVQALPEALTPAIAARWRSVGVAAEAAAVAVASHRIEFVGANSAILAESLREWGLEPRRHGRTLGLYLTADPLDDALKGYNAHALATGQAWMLIHPLHAGAWFTVFRPGHTPCWECLATRLRHNRPTRSLGATPPRLPEPLGGSVANRLAQFVATFAAEGEAHASERHWTFVPTIPDTRVRQHPLDRLRLCPACGDAGTETALPLRPHTALEPPVDYRRLLDPVTGIARDLRSLEAPGGVSAAVVRFRFPREVPPPSALVMSDERVLAPLMRSEQHVAGGKGWNPATAAACAVFEAAERIAGCFRATLSLRMATADELGASALLPHEVDLHSEAQRARPSPPGPPTALTVPFVLDPHLRTAWVRAQPLRKGVSDRWFPAAAAFYGFPFTVPRFAVATSNGCAAGPTMQDAVLGGLYELIERDAAAIWWYNRIPRPAIAVPELREARLERVAAALSKAGRSFALLDLTTDLGVPVVAAVSRRDSGLPGWTLGFGAAASHAEAALQATAELAQLLPATDDPTLPNPAPWSDTATEAANPHLVPTGHVQPITPRQPPGLAALIDTLAGAGLEGYVVDQTHPLTGIPVARVLVPGLVHFWRRLGAPRLYAVPVQMGWRSAPTPEAAMNPLDLTL